MTIGLSGSYVVVEKTLIKGSISAIVLTKKSQSFDLLVKDFICFSRL